MFLATRKTGLNVAKGVAESDPRPSRWELVWFLFRVDRRQRLWLTYLLRFYELITLGPDAFEQGGRRLIRRLSVRQPAPDSEVENQGTQLLDAAGRISDMTERGDEGICVQLLFPSIAAASSSRS